MDSGLFINQMLEGAVFFDWDIDPQADDEAEPLRRPELIRSSVNLRTSEPVLIWLVTCLELDYVHHLYDSQRWTKYLYKQGPAFPKG